MYKLVLIRHGQSLWNQTNQFTGWTDVDLSPRGVEEAKNAGKKLKEQGFDIQYAFTSYLKRAIKTLNYVLEEMDRMWIPVQKSWMLNEKHYGTLQGLNKAETAKKYGEEQVLIWRRSYDICPPALPIEDERHPCHELNYKGTPAANVGTEALKNTIDRIIPYWDNEILPKLKQYKQIVIAAHGNSLRGIVKYLKNIDNNTIVSLNIPTGIPYVFEFDSDMHLVKDYYLADEATLAKLMEEVANQGKTK